MACALGMWPREEALFFFIFLPFVFLVVLYTHDCPMQVDFMYTIFLSR